MGKKINFREVWKQCRSHATDDVRSLPKVHTHRIQLSKPYHPYHRSGALTSSLCEQGPQLSMGAQPPTEIGDDSEVEIDEEANNLAMDLGLRYLMRRNTEMQKEILDLRMEVQDLREASRTASLIAAAQVESAKAVVDVVVQKATCVVCFGHVSNPQILDCQHYMCINCSVTCLERSKFEESYRCPMCRAYGCPVKDRNLADIFHAVEAFFQPIIDKPPPQKAGPNKRTRRGEARKSAVEAD